MPEVGLEPGSIACKHWTPAQTYGIRASPAPVRPGPGPKVWTLFTPPFLPTRGLHPASRWVRRFFDLKNLILLEKFNRRFGLVLHAPGAQSRARRTA